MKSVAIESILRDFSTENEEPAEKVKDGIPITVWVPKEYKARYDRVQRTSGRKLSKRVRQVLMAVIDIVDKSA